MGSNPVAGRPGPSRPGRRGTRPAPAAVPPGRAARALALAGALALGALAGALASAPGNALAASGPLEPGQGERAATDPFPAPVRRDAGPAKLHPEDVLPDVDADAPMDATRARALREPVRIAREDADDALVRERIACYRRFFVNACLADVRTRERLVRARLDHIEVTVNRVLREADARALNERTAEALADRAARADEDARRRDENRRAFDARAASAEAGRAQRAAEAPELERRAAANRAERARRQAESDARRVEAERRAAGAPERAAARERALDAQRRDTEARDAREAAQRARRREEAARREADARRREAERDGVPRRPGAASRQGADVAPAMR